MSDKLNVKIASKLKDQNGDWIDAELPLGEENEKKDTNDGTDWAEEALPVLPLRNVVLFPGGLLPVSIGRKKSLKLVKDMEKRHRTFVAAAQKDTSIDDPTISDLCVYGVACTIVKVLELPGGNTTALIQGDKRVKLEQQVGDTPYLTAIVSPAPSERVESSKKKEFNALVSNLRETAAKVMDAQSNLPPDANIALKNIEDGKFLIGFIASNLEISLEKKIELISTASIFERGLLLLEYLSKEEQFINLKKDIQNKVKRGMDQQQREYMLQQQIRTIQDELGNNPVVEVVKDLKIRSYSKKWSEEVKEAFNKQLKKLERLNPASNEYSVEIGYAEAMLSLPWDEVSKDRIDIKRATKQLNANHFGMDNIKERILEHIAVLKLTGGLKSPILCLYGPPGVGKTSLCQSIAEALGRKYVRMSLGGMHDESEIRGHRRTYVGAMMGQIMRNIAKAGTSNPVFVLDEIDKIGKDISGDPQSALLEVLDPEQNSKFHDNYLDMDYDLSRVMFVATANNIGTISGPLLDRMELIDVSGYLLEEKIEIALRHLLPKQMENHGIPKQTFGISKKLMGYVIEKYTRESGVRELDKVMARLCRKVALEIAKGEEIKKSLTTADITKYLGIERFSHDIWQDNMKAGVVTGLAWTAVGGEILFIEANKSEGKGNMTLTGNLGDVMKESAILALEYVRSNASLWGLDDVKFDETHVHIHVPEGAVPKDGPSAGITMVTALVSAFSQRKVKKRYAMTGEITLRGKVLPVGGIKEKMLAAKRAGITDIVLSEENKKDISEIKEEYISGLTFHFVSEIPEVIEIALEAK